jgi:hypothetical protein
VGINRSFDGPHKFDCAWSKLFDEIFFLSNTYTVFTGTWQAYQLVGQIRAWRRTSPIQGKGAVDQSMNGFPYGL